MNNKGFTLIEIIMVIAILALLAILTTPNVISLINKNKVDNYNAVIDSIVKASEIYVSDNRYSLEFKDSSNNPISCSDNVNEISTNITLKTLVDSKDLSSEIINHCTNQEIINLDNIFVTITLDCETKNFSYVVDKDSNYFERKDNITYSSGKIIEGKYCTDLY